MDLGITNRKALVCASSKGLGRACAVSLAQAGCDVTINGRDAATLNQAVKEIEAETGAKVQGVQADINTPGGREKLLAACPEADILINNNAGPTPGDFLKWSHDDWTEALNANMLAALDLIKHVAPGMRERKFGRIVNITSAVVKTPRAHQTLSTAARTGLTAACKALSLIYVVDNVTINNLLPERFETGRQEFMTHKIMDADGITYDEARKKISDTIAAKRFGRPEEFGDTCAFVCSAQAGFMSGQNIQLDGGSYAGLI